MLVWPLGPGSCVYVTGYIGPGSCVCNLTNKVCRSVVAIGPLQPQIVISTYNFIALSQLHISAHFHTFISSWVNVASAFYSAIYSSDGN